MYTGLFPADLVLRLVHEARSPSHPSHAPLLNWFRLCSTPAVARQVAKDRLRTRQSRRCDVIPRRASFTKRLSRLLYDELGPVPRAKWIKLPLCGSRFLQMRACTYVNCKHDPESSLSSGRVMHACPVIVIPVTVSLRNLQLLIILCQFVFTTNDLTTPRKLIEQAVCSTNPRFPSAQLKTTRTHAYTAHHVGR